MYTNQKMNYILGIILFICLVLIVYECKKNTPKCESNDKSLDDKVASESEEPQALETLVIPPLSFSQTQIDYSLGVHWLVQPEVIEQEVDVFYLYPSAYMMMRKEDSKICSIDNEMMFQNASNAFSIQATAFEGLANIFAPLYRQVDAHYLFTLPLEQQQKIISNVPSQDAIQAFDYYIKHLNKGRPFILAGHSQGSFVLLFLLAEYMKNNPDVYARMIAAYVIGYSVTPAYLEENPHLTFANSADDVGVIISYNTEAPHVMRKNPVVLPGALVINPINWLKDDTPANALESLGSYLPNEQGKFEKTDHYADATLNKERGVIVCSTGSVDEYSTDVELFPLGNFHCGDYPFYYYNLRENAANRIKYFLMKQLEGILQLF